MSEPVGSWGTLAVRLPRDHFDKWHETMKRVARVLGMEPDPMLIEMGIHDGLEQWQRIKCYDAVNELLDVPEPMIKFWLDSGFRASR